MVAEDFSYYAQKIPGFYFFLGVKAPGQASAAPLHNRTSFGQAEHPGGHQADVPPRPERLEQNPLTRPSDL
jgi:metal-dependent amidase/aminoacylase/carboxypeptidase family protein